MKREGDSRNVALAEHIPLDADVPLHIVGNVDKLIQVQAVMGDLVVSAPSPVCPHELPAPIPDFVGRKEEITTLVSSLRHRSSAPSLACVTGMAGVGKTTLAEVVAHELRASFPDAQIVADAGGVARPRHSRDIAARVIAALRPELDASLAENADGILGLYRSVLADKRILILLDDAHDAYQVQSLVPPPGSALLVTSRNRFSVPGMETIELRELAPAEAERLLLCVCPRIASCAPHIARCCVNLPLAIRLSASTLASDDTTSVESYVERLRQERLLLLSDDTETAEAAITSVEASFALSYQALSRAQQGAFRGLAVFVSEFDLPGACAAMDVGALEDAAKLLGQLRTRNLVECGSAPGKYRLHDLLRDYGLNRLEGHEKKATHLRTANYYLLLLCQLHKATSGGAVATLRAATVARDARPNLVALWKWLRENPGDPESDRCNALFGVVALVGSRLLRGTDWGQDTCELLLSSLEAAEREGNVEVQAVLLAKLGKVVQASSLAQGYCHRSLELTARLREDKAALTVIANLDRHEVSVLRTLARDSERTDAAIQCLSRAEELAAKGGFARESGEICTELARLAHEKRDVVLARSYLERALEAAAVSKDPTWENELSWQFALLCEEQGNYTEAAQYGHAYVEHLRRGKHSEAAEYAEYVEDLQQRAHKAHVTARQGLVPVKASRLTSFPGMPVLTFNVKMRLSRVLPDAQVYLVRDETSLSAQQAETTAYDVYVDCDRVGRYTVRSSGARIERNFYCHLPVGTALPKKAIVEGSFGVSGSRLEDLCRALFEHAHVLVFKYGRWIRRRSREGLSRSPVVMPLWFGSQNKYSLLELHLGMDRDRSSVTTKRCEADGCDAMFVLPLVVVDISGVRGMLGHYTLDVGGYCPECCKYLCESHVALIETESEVHSTYTLVSCRLGCIRHQVALTSGPRTFEEVNRRREALVQRERSGNLSEEGAKELAAMQYVTIVGSEDSGGND